jgi:hypothetical protein
MQTSERLDRCKNTTCCQKWKMENMVNRKSKKSGGESGGEKGRRRERDKERRREG